MFMSVVDHLDEADAPECSSCWAYQKAKMIHVCQPAHATPLLLRKWFVFVTCDFSISLAQSALQKLHLQNHYRLLYVPGLIYSCTWMNDFRCKCQLRWSGEILSLPKPQKNTQGQEHSQPIGLLWFLTKVYVSFIRNLKYRLITQKFKSVLLWI